MSTQEQIRSHLCCIKLRVRRRQYSLIMWHLQGIWRAGRDEMKRCFDCLTKCWNWLRLTWTNKLRIQQKPLNIKVWWDTQVTYTTPESDSNASSTEDNKPHKPTSNGHQQQDRIWSIILHKRSNKQRNKPNYVHYIKQQHSSDRLRRFTNSNQIRSIVGEWIGSTQQSQPIHHSKGQWRASQRRSSWRLCRQEAIDEWLN